MPASPFQFCPGDLDHILFTLNATHDIRKCTLTLAWAKLSWFWYKGAGSFSGRTLRAGSYWLTRSAHPTTSPSSYKQSVWEALTSRVQGASPPALCLAGWKGGNEGGGHARYARWGVNLSQAFLFPLFRKAWVSEATLTPTWVYILI